MKSFINQHQKSLIIQLILILLVLILYLFSTKQYISSVTIQPIYTDFVIKSSDAPLSRQYPPSYIVEFYLKELSSEQIREEIFNEFLIKNTLVCDEKYILEPSFQVYRKHDKSFPVSGEFTNIKVKSACVELTKNYVTFLTNTLHKRLVEKIQKEENKFKSHLVNKLTLQSKNDLTNLEIFVSTRKANLRKLIPLLKEEKDSNFVNYSQIQTLNLPPNIYANVGDSIRTVNLDMQFPISYVAAQAELNFLSSVVDLSKSSIGLISRINKIEQFKINYDFSNLKLLNILPAADIATSKRNLYLAIFFIFIILCLGYVFMALNQYRYHQKMQ